MAQDQVARLAARGRSRRSGSRRPSPRRAARGSASSEKSQLIRTTPRRRAAPPPRPARAPRGSCPRPRSRSRGGRRRAAPGRIVSPTCEVRARPARRPGTRAPSRASRSRVTRPVGSGPGSAVRNRIASGWLKRGRTSSSGSSSPSAMPELHLDEVDADRVPRRGRPSARPGSAPRTRPRRRGRPAPRSAAGTRSRSRSPSARTVCAATRSDSRELVAEDRRRVDVDPADAEADARRAQPVGERQRDRLAVARDHDPVHLDARRRTPRGSPRRSATPTSASCRCASRSSSDSTRKMPRCPPESAGFSTAGNADLVGRAPPLGERAQRREARLRHAGLGELPPHRDLVRHQVRGLDADPRQAERLGDRGDDRHRAVGRDGQHAVELERRDRLDHRRRRR